MIWQEAAGGQISGPATVIGDVVYVSTFSGNATIGLDLGTGRRVFSLRRRRVRPGRLRQREALPDRRRHGDRLRPRSRSATTSTRRRRARRGSSRRRSAAGSPQKMRGGEWRRGRPRRSRAPAGRSRRSRRTSPASSSVAEAPLLGTVRDAQRAARRRPDRHARRGHRPLRLGDRVGAVVEDRGDQDRVGAALGDPLGEVLELADAAGGDHRDRHGVGDRARERQVVALLGAVAVHAGQQDLPRPALGRLPRPADGLATLDALAAALDVDVPALAAGTRAARRSRRRRTGRRRPRPARRSAPAGPARPS